MGACEYSKSVSRDIISDYESGIYWADFLQERLTQETSRPAFSQLPFRFAEVAKILLDV